MTNPEIAVIGAGYIVGALSWANLDYAATGRCERLTFWVAALWPLASLAFIGFLIADKWETVVFAPARWFRKRHNDQVRTEK